MRARSRRTARAAGSRRGRPRASLPGLRRALERRLAAALPRTAVPERLHAAMRYAALAPGKRVRPLLLLATCAAVGGAWRRALPAAVAIECVHAFSLVHDDLPAMDDDDFRRGRPTTHRRFGEGLAILAGDALLALAFEHMARLTDGDVPAARALASTRALARACGSRELMGGQALDLAAEGRPVGRADVRAIHARKTGALLSAALEIGARIGGAGEARVARLARAGRSLGVAFQIHDDLLNRGSSLRVLGKRGGTDEARGKATWPRAVGEARARRDAARLLAGVEAEVGRLGAAAAPLATLIAEIGSRTR